MDSMPIPSYSIAIRTLGTAGEKFRQELASIKAQTRQPDRVLVYIAEVRCSVVCGRDRSTEYL